MAQVVKASDLKVSRRGRTAKRIPEVLTAIKNLAPGEALILDEFGKVEDDEKSRVYQSVRAHWTDVRDDACRVSFDPTTGMVQVEAKPSKKGAAKK